MDIFIKQYLMVFKINFFIDYEISNEYKYFNHIIIFLKLIFFLYNYIKNNKLY